MFARIREWFFNLTAVLIALVVLSSFLIASYELESWPFGDRRTFRERSPVPPRGRARGWSRS